MKSASSPVLAVAVSGLLQLAFVSCTPRTASGPATTDELEANEADLQRLRALPYVAWDEGADPELRGVLSWDESRAWSGYNLYTNDVDEAYLMDMSGRRVHRWKLPRTRNGHCEHVELLEDGEILAVCVNDGAFHLDWASRVLAETTIGVHHDAAVMPDGRRVIPFHDGRYIHRRRLVWFDGLASLNSDLELVDRWSSFERLDDLTPHHPRSPLEKPGSWSRLLSNTSDYYHLNSVESLPATDLGARDPRFRPGQLMLCFRNTDLVVILDQDSHDVVWSWGPGELDGPHMPTLLPSGNILVFDNGTRRRYSRVVEIDPTTKEVRWEYEGEPRDSFFSAWRGSAQRLVNGNTLICEADRGHAFEVTPEGETVWEFWNPELGKKGRKRIYRMTRVAPYRLGSRLPAI